MILVAVDPVAIVVPVLKSYKADIENQLPRGLLKAKALSNFLGALN